MDKALVLLQLRGWAGDKERGLILVRPWVPGEWGEVAREGHLAPVKRYHSGK